MHFLQTKRRFSALRIAMLRAACPLSLSFCCLFQQNAAATDSVNTDMNDLVQQIRQLDDLSKLVQKEYIKPITREELWNGAIRGMIESLDHHSHYFTKDETALYGGQQADRGRGFGFDWAIDHEQNEIRISRVIPGSSAEQQGLLAGDVILKIDGESIFDLKRNHIRRLFIHAEKQLPLHIRQADSLIKSIILERSDFADTGVLEPQLIQKNIGYLRISRFRDGSVDKQDEVEGIANTLTGRAFRQQLDVLSTKELRALIIDLRGNGGGSIRAAVEVADCFLNSGPDDPRVIVEQVSRNNLTRSYAYTASSVNTYPHWPICVLIDEHTASSAEILAAALQDHKRALIVGSKSTGKTSIQETFMLDNGSSIRLSVAHYQTPNGQDLDGKGLTPDVESVQSPLNKLHVQRREAFLAKGQEVPAELKDAIDPVKKQAADILTGILVFKED